MAFFLKVIRVQPCDFFYRFELHTLTRKSDLPPRARNLELNFAVILYTQGEKKRRSQEILGRVL